MRKQLLGFLVLVMLTPVLTCAMSFCPMQAAQAQTQAQEQAQKPCHQSDDGQSSSPMFILDCMGVDLFSQDINNNDLESGQSLDGVDFA